jgi:hypothetical protein
MPRWGARVLRDLSVPVGEEQSARPRAENANVRVKTQWLRTRERSQTSMSPEWSWRISTSVGIDLRTCAQPLTRKENTAKQKPRKGKHQYGRKILAIVSSSIGLIAVVDTKASERVLLLRLRYVSLF